MRFSKWHAHGNAYLVVERADAGAVTRERARVLCDPATGLGADGVLEVTEQAGPRAEIVIWNPDGSVAEMSGNGTRIAAAWLAARTDADEVWIETAGRVVTARPRADGLIEQELAGIGVGARETIDVDGESVDFVPVDVGNPHAVVPVTDVTRERLLRLGPLIERHQRFPERTNVQLAAPQGPHDMRALVWERGAGETASSGSSAVAVAAAAVGAGWCNSPVTVHFPGGDLLVILDGSGTQALLVGPAVEICRGEVVSPHLHDASVSRTGRGRS